MSQSTPSWTVIPTLEEILAANGNVKIQIFTTLLAAQTAATIGAISSGQDRTIYQAESYASATVAGASITAQLNSIPQS